MEFLNGLDRRRLHRAMRISVVNWRTSKEDVERTRQAVASVLESEQRQQRLRG
jgi:hypothetical protein